MKGDPDVAVAQALVDMSDVITESLYGLLPVHDLTRDTMNHIVDLHGLITNNLATQLHGANPRPWRNS